MRTVTVGAVTPLRVDPDFRGNGVGGLLVDHFLDWARRQGARKASVTAFAANEGAQRLYRRHGFASMTVTMRAEL